MEIHLQLLGDCTGTKRVRLVFEILVLRKPMFSVHGDCLIQVSVCFAECENFAHVKVVCVSVVYYSSLADMKSVSLWNGGVWVTHKGVCEGACITCAN